MARPAKQGLDYFPMDVDMPEDDKMMALEVEHGPAACWYIIKLWCSLFRVGYCYRWSEKDEKIFAHKCRIPVEELREYLRTAFEFEVFDHDVWTRTGFLTSKGIQRRYLEVVKKRKNVKIDSANWLLSEFPASFCGINSAEGGFPENKPPDSGVNAELSTQIERETERETERERERETETNSSETKTSTLLENYTHGSDRICLTENQYTNLLVNWYHGDEDALKTDILAITSWAKRNGKTFHGERAEGAVEGWLQKKPQFEKSRGAPTSTKASRTVGVVEKFAREEGIILPSEVEEAVQS